MCIYPCHIELWGTSRLCTWPYFIYNAHNPSWKHHPQTLSSLHRWYSIVHIIPTGCISIKRGSYISSRGMYQEYKDIRTFLKLNDDKTGPISLTTHYDTSEKQHITITSRTISLVGVLFDSTCSLNGHVSTICKSINHNLYSSVFYLQALFSTVTLKLVLLLLLLLSILSSCDHSIDNLFRNNNI